jgi:ribosomal protein S18 acetylase RimI-like enzyme
MGNRVQFKAVTRANFHELMPLVREQASHHKCAYTGDDEKFIQAIEKPHSAARILMMRDDAANAPLGYILYSKNRGLKGTEVYLEDVLVSRKGRGAGIGSGMMEAMRDYACDKNADAMNWTVTRNNYSAIHFYSTRIGAKGHSDTTILDGSSLLASPPQGSADFSVHRVEPSDLDLLDSYVGRIQALTPQKMANIRAAADGPNSRVFAAFDSSGAPAALAVANSNFSSFRTVYGWKLEMMELAAPDIPAACRAFDSTLSHVVHAARDEDHTGHLNLFVDRNSLAQTRFAQGLGLKPLMMSDDPSSVLDFFGIGRDAIHAPRLQNRNAPQDSPAPPKKVAGGLGNG